MSEPKANRIVSTDSTNRAKLYQLVLFPLNNGATNVYFVLILSYVAQFGSSVLKLGMYASIMVTFMRVFDAITDPIIGALMDRTSTKIGKFRPFMMIGSAIMAVSVVALYILTPFIPESAMWLRYVLFTLVYAVWVIGYTFQTSCTRAGQTVLTNDPNQRPMFTIFNTIGSMLGMGVMTETGVLGDIAAWIDYNIHNIWIVGIVSGFLSSFVDTFTIAITNISLYPVVDGAQLDRWVDSDYMGLYVQNGFYWPVVAFCTAVGGCLLSVGSTSGLALMKMEHMKLGWYLKNLTPKVLLGFAIGLLLLWVETILF